MNTRITRPVARAFRAAHPACRIAHLPEAAELRAALAGCDRVRVRSGGTCCRGPETEKELFVERDPTTLAALVKALDVREDVANFFCKCCGDPTLELFRGDLRIATLGFHHGRSVRWVDGRWPSDGQLTEAGQRWLCRWLADHGVVDPQRERDAAEARVQAGRRWWDQRRALVGEPGVARLRKARGAAELKATLEALAATPAERALLALRLVGCHEGPWSDCDALDAGLLDWLAEAWPDLNARELLDAAGADARAALGAARLCFAHLRSAAPTEPQLGAALGALAKAGLEHPQPQNRASTLIALRKLEGEAALALLRRALAGEFVPRRVAPEELVAPSGAVIVWPSDPVRAACGAPLPALAALCLAERGDAGSLAAIRALEERAQGAERELLATARQKLEKR